MNRELTAYLRLQAVIAAAFNFFISGMIAGLIYHKADSVPTDPISVAVDITITCLLTLVITTPFCRASLRRDKTGGVLTATTPQARILAWLFRHPVLLCVSLGLSVALVLSALAVPLIALLGVTAMPFFLYVALKSVLSAGLGALATCAVLCAGMFRAG